MKLCPICKENEVKPTRTYCGRRCAGLNAKKYKGFGGLKGELRPWRRDA